MVVMVGFEKQDRESASPVIWGSCPPSGRVSLLWAATWYAASLAMQSGKLRQTSVIPIIWLPNK
eukprot:scaffold306019_cov12-Tisochrysis_lutea.AAC.1